jgi:hypothetical protein
MSSPSLVTRRPSTAISARDHGANLAFIAGDVDRAEAVARATGFDPA